MYRGEGNRPIRDGYFLYISNAAPTLVTAHAEGSSRLLTFGLPRFPPRRRFWSWNYGDSRRRAYDHFRDTGFAPIRLHERRPKRFRAQPLLETTQGHRGGKRRCVRPLLRYASHHGGALPLLYIGVLDYRALVARLPVWTSLIALTAGGRGSGSGSGSGELSRPRRQRFLPRSNGLGGQTFQCLALVVLPSSNEGGLHLRSIRPRQVRTMPAIALPHRSGGNGKVSGAAGKARCDIPWSPRR